MAGEQSGGWVVKFQNTGRYYAVDQLTSTSDLDRAATYPTQAGAHGAALHIKKTWVDPGPLDVVNLTGARVETLTGRNTTDQQELPQELDHLLWAAFPPGNRSAGGFERGLVQLFTDADAWNFVRLAQGFPLHAVAMILWDAGLIHVRMSGERGWGADQKLVEDRAPWTWLKRPDKTWHQKFDGIRFILNSPRTASQGRQVSLPEVDYGR
jgi:hypothetical protein